MRRYLLGASISIDGEDAESLRVRIEDALVEVLRRLDRTASVELSDPIDMGPANGQRSTARQRKLFGSAV